MKTENLLLIGAAVLGGYYLAPKEVKEKVNDALGGAGNVFNLPAINVSSIPGVMQSAGASATDLFNAFLAGTKAVTEKIPTIQTPGAQGPVGSGGILDKINAALNGDYSISPSLKVAPVLDVSPGIKLNPAFEVNPTLNGATVGDMWGSLVGGLNWLQGVFSGDIETRPPAQGLNTPLWNRKDGFNTGFWDDRNWKLNVPATLALQEGSRANSDMASAAPSNVDRPISPITAAVATAQRAQIQILDTRPNSGPTGATVTGYDYRKAAAYE